MLTKLREIDRTATAYREHRKGRNTLFDKLMPSLIVVQVIFSMIAMYVTWNGGPEVNIYWAASLILASLILPWMFFDFRKFAAQAPKKNR